MNYEHNMSRFWDEIDIALSFKDECHDLMIQCESMSDIPYARRHVAKVLGEPDSSSIGDFKYSGTWIYFRCLCGLEDNTWQKMPSATIPKFYVGGCDPNRTLFDAMVSQGDIELSTDDNCLKQLSICANLDLDGTLKCLGVI